MSVNCLHANGATIHGHMRNGPCGFVFSFILTCLLHVLCRGLPSRCRPLFSATKLVGLDFVKDGLRVDLHRTVPAQLGAFHYRSKLATISRGEDGSLTGASILDHLAMQRSASVQTFECVAWTQDLLPSWHAAVVFKCAPPLYILSRAWLLLCTCLWQEHTHQRTQRRHAP